MKMQKRGFVLVLSAVLCVSTLLTGCGHKKNDIKLSADNPHGLPVG